MHTLRKLPTQHPRRKTKGRANPSTMIFQFPSLNLYFSISVQSGVILLGIGYSFTFKPFLLNIVWDLRRCQFLTGIRLSSPPGTSASGENGFYILNLAFPGKITHLYAFPPLASWV
jgi:hypothetical protein